MQLLVVCVEKKKPKNLFQPLDAAFLNGCLPRSLVSDGCTVYFNNAGWKYKLSKENWISR